MTRGRSGRRPADDGPPDPRGRIVAIDAEGRGRREAGLASLCEIAAVEILGGRRTGRVFHTCVNPCAPVSPYAEAIHGLGAAFLARQPVFADVAPDLLSFLGEAPLVAHGAGGDRAMLDHDLALAGLPPLAPGRFVCTQRLGRRLLKADTSLDTLCDALAVDRSARNGGHGALVDAGLTADCFVALARLPGYADARGVRVDAAAPRRPAGRVRCTVAHGIATFSVEGGGTLRAPVPPYPADTHAATVGADGVLRITRRGGRMPDNPQGPALLRVHQGRVVGFRFDGGRLVPEGEGDAP